MKAAMKSKCYVHESGMAGEKGMGPRKAMASGDVVRRTLASAAAHENITRPVPAELNTGGAAYGF